MTTWDKPQLFVIYPTQVDVDTLIFLSSYHMSDAVWSTFHMLLPSITNAVRSYSHSTHFAYVVTEGQDN